MRRLTWISGLANSVGLAVVVSLTVPAAMDRDARAAEVTAHERHITELEVERDATRVLIDEARADLGAQREQNDDADERIAKQERRLERLRERIEELDG